MLLNYNAELLAAEDQLKEPVRRTIKSLQSKGYLRQDMDGEWMLNVLYSLLFTMWQQVQEGTIAKIGSNAHYRDVIQWDKSIRYISIISL